MIRLHQYYPVWGLPNASPFCMKLETYLRMTAIPFEVVLCRDPLKSPKGKLPCIEHEGKIIGDSGFIVDYFQEKFGDKLDSFLSLDEKAVSHSMRRMIEENLYWALVHFRWVNAANWKITREIYFGKMPALLRFFLPEIIRKKTLKQIWGHGMGRHTEKEIEQIGIRDIKALSDFLGIKDFFMGETPTSLDATAYAFLANILWVPIPSAIKQATENFKNLVTYAERMKKRFYA